MIEPEQLHEKKAGNTEADGVVLAGLFVKYSREILQENLAGVYLHGSAVMGCYQPKKSDLDFLVVVKKDMTDADKRAFLDSVIALDAAGPAKGIEMSVVTRDVCDPFVYPTPFILHYSRMHTEWYRRDPEDYIRKMNGTDRDLAAHFTVIRERGVCLYGLPVPEVFGKVPEGDYLDAVWDDISGAKEEITENPMYLILNLARVLAWLEERKVLSKKEGGEWGLGTLPEEYRPLVRSALREYAEGADVSYDPETAKRYAGYMLDRIREEREKQALPGTHTAGNGSSETDAAGTVEQAAAGDAETAAALACELWLHHDPEKMTREFEACLADEETAVFLYRKQGGAAGFAQCQLRHDYVEGTETSPVGYLEGIYVKEADRGQGIARRLLAACEDWARGKGCTEFASDCELTNTVSQAFHRAVGFTEANRIVAYTRKL